MRHGRANLNRRRGFLFMTIYRLTQRLLLRFFRVFHLLDVRGLEHVPATGPVIVAANHVNPFDAVIIGACMPRRIRFVVWNRTFNLPVIGWLLRLTGCIPVNRDRPDTAAFRESLRWLETGQILGIFPEGKYTLDGHLDDLKPGTMRIALAARATVVPATLTGAYKAWPLRGPHAKLLPHPWKITIKFHPPIQTDAADASVAGQRAAAAELTCRLQAAINSTLEPAMRAERKVDRLVEQPAPHIRIYEWFFCVAMVLAGWGGQVDWWALGLAALYLAYLIVDTCLVRQTWLTRAVRNFTPVLALGLAWPVWHRLFGPMPAFESIAGNGLRLTATAVVTAYLAWSLVMYHFFKYLHFQRYVRGLLVSLYLAILMLTIAIDWRDKWLTCLMMTVTLYGLAYDFAHDRARFWLALAPVAGVSAAIAWTRGYPLTMVAATVLIVGAAFLYINLFKFRAHDGRRI
jgi:1-acyl-sn-glycerol-3-phosphate acyltransferase